jgi:hypothetical protein
MPKYLLKRCGLHLFVADCPEVVDDHTQARTFGGRLSARIFLENRFGKDAAQQLDFELIKLEDVVPPPRVVAPQLVIPDPLEAVRLVAAWHEEYCQRIEEFLVSRGHCDRQSLHRPTAAATILATHKWTGIYQGREHACKYAVTHAMTTGEAHFRTVVDHEVTHAYQRAFCGWNFGHDGAFCYLMEHAMGRKLTNPRDPDTCDMELGRLAAEYLHPTWIELRVAGKLQGLPMPVAHEKLPRDDAPEEGDVE